MIPFLLWLTAAAACALLFPSHTRNAGFFALAGTVMGLLFYYEVATVPEVRDLALILWAAALFLAGANTRAHRRRRLA